MKVYREIEDAEDFRLWCEGESWGCDDLVESIEKHNDWEEVWRYAERTLPELIEKTSLNDFVRFTLPVFWIKGK